MHGKGIRRAIWLASCPWCGWQFDDGDKDVAKSMLVVHATRHHREEPGEHYLDWAENHVQECTTRKEEHEKRKDNQHAGSLLPAA